MRTKCFTGAVFAFALVAPLVAAGASAVRPAVPFLEDEYPKALAEARSKKLPIFVEAWAPW